jgi:hypothetical protein
MNKTIADKIVISFVYIVVSSLINSLFILIRFLETQSPETINQIF